jgi:Ca-activated chloride channel family protein
MRRRGSFSGRLGILIAVLVVFYIVRGRDSQPKDDDADTPRASDALDRAIAPAATPAAARDGIAAAILIDVSGSMREKAGGGPPKIESAQRAAIDLVDQFARYADDHKGEPVELAIFEFSDRGGVPDTREVIPMGPPDRSRAAAAVARMEADGGTPIGDAMIEGKRALDATGLSRKHLLVITDGENTTGAAPADVAAAIGRRPLEERPSLYFVAFDISARRFDSVRTNGGLVLEAANAKALNDTLDSLLRGKILIER